MTLNGLAHLYISSVESNLLLPFAPLAAGFLLGLLPSGGANRIARGSHWLAVLALVLLGTAQQFLWLAYPAAVKLNFGWLMPASDIVSGLAIGVLLARLGKARSRDAWGHTRGAVLQVIPLANLFLLLAKSRDETPAHPRLLVNWELSPALTAVIGIFMIVTNQGLNRGLETTLAQTFDQASLDDDFNAAFLRHKVEVEGIVPLIDESIAATPLPIQIEQGHNVTEMSRQGNEWHVVHEIDIAEDEVLSPEYLRALTSDLCHALPWLMDNDGAMVRHFRRTSDGVEFQTLHITLRECLV